MKVSSRREATLPPLIASRAQPASRLPSELDAALPPPPCSLGGYGELVQVAGLTARTSASFTAPAAVREQAGAASARWRGVFRVFVLLLLLLLLLVLVGGRFAAQWHAGTCFFVLRTVEAPQDDNSGLCNAGLFPASAPATAPLHDHQCFSTEEVPAATAASPLAAIWCARYVSLTVPDASGPEVRVTAGFDARPGLVGAASSSGSEVTADAKSSAGSNDHDGLQASIAQPEAAVIFGLSFSRLYAPPEASKVGRITLSLLALSAVVCTRERRGRKSSRRSGGTSQRWIDESIRLLCIFCLLGLQAALSTGGVVGRERDVDPDTVAAAGDDKGIWVSRTRPPSPSLPTTSTPTRGFDLLSELEFLLENFATLSVDEHALIAEVVVTFRSYHERGAGQFNAGESSNGGAKLDISTYKGNTESPAAKDDDPETTAELGDRAGGTAGGANQRTDSKRSNSAKTESPGLGGAVAAASASNELGVLSVERKGVDGLGPGPTRLLEDDVMITNPPVGFELAQHEESSKGGNRTRMVLDDEETREHSKFGVLSSMLSTDPHDEASSRLLATINVLTQDLLAAYNSAAVGDTINLTPSPAAYTGAACTSPTVYGATSLCMTNAVSIICAVGAASGSCTFDGLNGRRVVTVETGTSATTVFQQITFTRGSLFEYKGNSGTGGDGGGIYISSSTVTLTACTVTSNNAGANSGGGGGIVVHFSTVTLTTCTFTSNNAGAANVRGDGGGIRIHFSTVTLTTCTFTSNTAGYGGGMFISRSTVTLTTCTFTSNAAEAGGGAIYVYESHDGVTLYGVVFSLNGGSDIYNEPGDDGSTVTVYATCPAGYYTSATKGSALGIVGAVSGSLFSYMCPVCSAGRYKTTSLTVCTSCDAGRYLNDAATSPSLHDEASDCTVCGTGSYDVSAGVVFVCCAGTYNTSTGPDPCSVCSAGKYLSDPGTSSELHDAAADCSDCPVGKYLVDSATDAYSHDSYDDCLACVSGKYGTDTTAPCSACVGSSVAPTPGLAACIPCAGGNLANSDRTACLSSSSCEVGYGLAEDAGSCIQCPFGKYKGVVAAAQCTACVAGKSTSILGSTSASDCSPCAVGKFNQDGVGGLCTDCAAGKANASSGSSAASACVDCEKGKSSSNHGLSVCLVCAAGKYAEFARLTFCSLCDNGKTIDDDSLTESAHDNASDCASCVPGKYANTPSLCDNWCPLGKANGNSGSIHLSDCISCAAGQESSADFGSCVSCPVGKYNPSSGTSCVRCGVGKYLASTGASNEMSCQTCDPGTSTNNIAGSSTCTDCAPGRAAPSSGYSQCDSCVGGTYANGNKSVRCVQCDVGNYADTVESDSCKSCASGKYAVAIGAITCTSCTKQDEFSVSLQRCACITGTLEMNGEDERNRLCSACPEGATCGTPGTTIASLEVLPGFWRTSSSSQVIEPCPAERACIGNVGNPFSSNVCAPGYEGPLCAVCMVGHAPRGTGRALVCEKCSGNALATVAVGVSVIVVFLLSSAYYFCIWQSTDEEKGDGDTTERKRSTSKRIQAFADRNADTVNIALQLLKIFVSYFQVVGGLAFAFDLNFPPVFASTIDFLSGLVNVNFISLMPLGCILPSNFHKALLGYTIIPILFSLVLCVVYFVRRKREKSKYHRHKIFGTFLFMTFMILPTISVKVFSTFACKTFDGDYGRFLKVDYSIDCDSGEHSLYVAYAAVMIAVYPFGIPSMYYVLLKREKHKLNPPVQAPSFESERYELALKERELIENNDPRVKRLSFLYSAYAPRYWWFEVFETLRKLALTGGLVVVSPGSAGQIVFSMLVCLLSTRVYSECKPFLNRSVYHVFEAGQWQLFLTMFAALALRVNIDNENLDDKRYFDVVLVSLQFVAPIAVFLSTVLVNWWFGNRLKSSKEAGGSVAPTVPAARPGAELVTVTEEKSRPGHAAVANREQRIGEL